MADPVTDYWLCEFTINGESHHIMILQGAANKDKTELSLQQMMDAHAMQHPHLKMAIVSLEKMQDAEQVDRRVIELKAKYPKQRFANEIYPNNPNALLFQPLNTSEALLSSGRAEEALIRYLCGG